MPRLPLLIGTFTLFSLLSLGVFVDHKSNLAVASASQTEHMSQSDQMSQGDHMSQSEPAKVAIANDAFDPATMTVAAGTKVTWTNKDDDPHTITSFAPLFDSNGMAQGDSYSFVFRKPGKYEYYCKVHPFMKGVILVKEQHS